MTRPLRIAFVIDRAGVVDMLSIPVVAAIARGRGCVVSLIEYGRNPKRAARKLQSFAPRIVAYSVCSNEVERYVQINRELKKVVPFFSLFGGPLPTYVPECIREEGIDAICRGEADLAFPRFLDAFGTRDMYETPNFSFRLEDGSIVENALVDLVPDLDQTPFPARDLIYAISPVMARNPIKAFMAGRGCPFGCNHCFNNAYSQLYRGKGRMVRTKSVACLLEEIRDVAGRYPLGFVRFHDDVFGLDRKWMAEFAEQFPKKIGLPFSCYVHPHMVSDEHVRLLKQAGCHSVCTAIECGNEALRIAFLNRQATNGQIVEACRKLKEAGIRLFSFNMLGLPGETEEDMWETIRLNRRVRVDFADVSVFHPYPGTDAFDYCKEHGYLADEAGRFTNIYTESHLKLDAALRQKIFVLHKFFFPLVMMPRLASLAKLFYRTRVFNRLLNLFYRLHYGHYLHHRIYGAVVPFSLQLRAAWNVLFSKDRT